MNTTVRSFEQAEHDLGGLLIDMVGGEDNVAGLFDFSNYDLTSWMTDYMDKTMRETITRNGGISHGVIRGSISLCDYYPPTDDNSILNGGAWTRFKTTDPGFYPNASQREQVLANSEGYAGWSRNRVQQLNNQNDGFSYSINYWQQGYIISRGGKQTKKAYAYEIHVTKSWNREEIIYEDVFDSYSMDFEHVSRRNSMPGSRSSTTMRTDIPIIYPPARATIIRQRMPPN